MRKLISNWPTLWRCVILVRKIHSKGFWDGVSRFSYTLDIYRIFVRADILRSSFLLRKILNIYIKFLKPKYPECESEITVAVRFLFKMNFWWILKAWSWKLIKWQKMFKCSKCVKKTHIINICISVVIHPWN